METQQEERDETSNEYETQETKNAAPTETEKEKERGREVERGKKCVRKSGAAFIELAEKEQKQNREDLQLAVELKLNQTTGITSQNNTYIYAIKTNTAICSGNTYIYCNN